MFTVDKKIIITFFIALVFCSLSSFVSAAPFTVHYSYDDLNRLTNVTHPRHDYIYKYDEIGNITQREVKHYSQDRIHVPGDAGDIIEGTTATFTWSVLPDDYWYFVQLWIEPAGGNPIEYLSPYEDPNTGVWVLGWPDGVSHNGPLASTFLNNSYTTTLLPNDGRSVTFRVFRKKKSGWVVREDVTYQSGS